jgi:hypothetical protein
METFPLLYWSIGGIVLFLALISLYYYSCHCKTPSQKIN